MRPPVSAHDMYPEYGAATPLTGARILIADDQEINRLILNGILSQDGYELMEVENGTEALEAVKHFRPELILLDIMMPVKDGYAVCKELKNDPGSREIPVIFLSALSEAADKVKGLEIGAIDYVTKPFDHAEVLARVRVHLRIQRLTQALRAANRALAEKQAALDADLRAAGDIQRCLIPSAPPPLESVQFAWRFMPCDDSGGDVFNIYTLDDTHLALYILDVSGHGVPSAMVTVSVSQMLSLQAGTTRHTNGGQQLAAPAEVLSALAAEYPFERFQKFFTIAYLVLNHRDGTLRYSGAGHPEPVVQRRNGSIELLSAGGTIIGLGNAIPFEEGALRLHPGDRLFLYTDGIVEYANAAGEFFGTQRFLQALQENRSQPLEAACDHLIATMQRFGSGTAPTDDVTLVALEMHETDSL